MTTDVAYFILRLGVGGVCLWASLEKASHPKAFAEGVGQYRLLPARLAPGMAIALIAIELGLGLALLAGVAGRGATLGATILFALFAGAIAVNLLRKRAVPCNCFGAAHSEPISAATLVRAAALLGLSWLAWRLAGQGPTLPPRHAILPALTIAAAIIMATRLVGALPQAWASWRAAPSIPPTTSHRLSFRDQPLDRSFRMPTPTMVHLNGLGAVQAVQQEVDNR